MSEKIYAKGIRCFNKNPKQASFVIGSMVINVDEFVEWLNSEGKQYFTEYNGQNQIKFQVLQSDKTGINLLVDTWKPNQ